MDTAFGIFCFVFLCSFGQANLTIIEDYNGRKIIMQVLSKTYREYLETPNDSALQKLIREDYLNYYRTHYANTFTWLHEVVVNQESLLGDNLLKSAAIIFKNNRKDFLIFIDKVKYFAREAFNAEWRYLILSEQKESFIKSIVDLYKTYLTNIDNTLPLALAHFDLDNFYFKTEVEKFVENEKLKTETAHQSIHDFLAKKYTFRSWLVVLFKSTSLNLGCHREVQEVVVRINDDVSAVIFNIPRDSKINEEEAYRLYEVAMRGIKKISCSDGTEDIFEILKIECSTVKWTKVISLFYVDPKQFNFAVTDQHQIQYRKISSHSRCRHKYALLIFG